MADEAIDFQYRCFVVDERPMCVWGTDIGSNVIDFLESVDPTYFEFIANIHAQHVSEDQPRERESQHAALAIRATYSQALETLFALLGAAIQAPHCVHAWIGTYQPRELYNLVRKLHNRQPVLSRINSPVLTWSAVSDILFANLVLADKERESSVKQGFGQLWSWLASQFLDDDLSKEYNSIKHGLRVRSGGFYLAMEIEEQPGVPPSDDKMRVIGKSEFGSSYFASEKISDAAHHVQLRRHHRNWSPEDLCWSLHLISGSIANIVAALKIINGVPAEDVQFSWPSDPEVFKEPWKRSIQIGVLSMRGFEANIHPDFILPFSKDDILARYQAGSIAGNRRIIFTGDEPSNEPGAS